MPTSTPWPVTERFSRFLLGTLSADESRQLVDWIDGHPEQAEALGEIQPTDDFVALLMSASRYEQPPSSELDRVIQDLTRHPEGRSTSLLQPAGFRILRQLGEGGMGAVYEAHDERTSRLVAIKMMHPRLALDEHCRARFLREGRAMGAIESDHVVPIFAVGETDDVPYLVMKRLKGLSLEEWAQAKEEPATPAEVLWVAVDALKGLVAAHARGLIHRDIKPHNLYVDQSTGRVLVLDFGLARGADPDASLTAEGDFLGTPTYASPEQARGVGVDHRTDLFSLGVTIYRLVAGKSPYERDTARGTLTAVVTEAALPLAIDAEVSAFVAKLMAKEVSERFGSAEEALAEATRLQRRLTAPPESSPRKPRGWGLIAAGIGIVAMLMLVAGVIVIEIEYRKKTGESWIVRIVHIGNDSVEKDKLKKDKPTPKLGQQDEGKDKPKDKIRDSDTGKKVVVPLPPDDRAKGKERNEPEKDDLGVGARVVVIANTGAHADETLVTLTNQIDGGTVDRGATGVVLAVNEEGEPVCKVRLTSPKAVEGVEAWLLKRTLKVE